MNVFWISLRMLFVMTVLFGFIYSLAVTGLAQVIWPDKANGSLVKVNQTIVGSSLLVQSFADAKYFWPRPSAASYGTVASGASNAAVTNAAFGDQVRLRRQQFAQANEIKDSDVPAEMIFASASGLDPHISLQSARVQMARITQARGFNSEQQVRLKGLVESLVEEPQLGFLGQQRINVLLLNIKLDLI